MQFGKAEIQIYNDPKSLGLASANFVASSLDKVIKANGQANMILATGTSQFTFLEALKSRDIDWQKINVFHLDEYIGIPKTHPASFRKYLSDRILNSVNPKNIYLIEGDAENLEKELSRYENLLKSHPTDIACIGIGENGHIAFNDPPVADFKDPVLIKSVELDEPCRLQQFGEGWFPSLNEVPKFAVTLTIPAIMSSGVICCVVPDARKAPAVQQAVNGPLSTNCPASILRTHSQTILFLDNESAGGLDN